MFILSCDSSSNPSAPVIQGCTDESACNYDMTASEDDGTCAYADDYYNCNGELICDETVELWGMSYSINTTTSLNIEITSENDPLNNQVIPDNIGCLVNLTRINIENYANGENGFELANGLIGSIPESIGNLINLERLNFQNNSLTNGIPLSICNLNNTLEELDLDYNQLGCFIPECIYQFPNLIEFGSFQLGIYPENPHCCPENISNIDIQYWICNQYDDNNIVIPPANFLGCMDPDACNYNELANINDGSCWNALEECSCEDGEGAVYNPETGTCDTPPQ